MKKLFKRYKRQIFGFLACLVAIVPMLTLFCSASYAYPNTPTIDYQIGGHSLYEFASHSSTPSGYDAPYLPTFVPSVESPSPVDVESIAYYLAYDDLYAQRLITSLEVGDLNNLSFSVEFNGGFEDYNEWSHDGDSYLSFSDFYFFPSYYSNPFHIIECYYYSDGMPSSVTFYCEWYELGSTVSHYEEIDLSYADDGVYEVSILDLSSHFQSSDIVYIYSLGILFENDGSQDVYLISADLPPLELAPDDLRYADVERAIDNTISDSDVLTKVLDVFSNVGTWIVTSVQNLISMFFVDGSLTFLGVLAISGLAISVILLLLSVIVNFLRFRG